ncbi:hypothetical protein SNEBB_000851, partial [Seison nebaliae]
MKLKNLKKQKIRLTLKCNRSLLFATVNLLPLPILMCRRILSLIDKILWSFSRYIATRFQ